MANGSVGNHGYGEQPDRNIVKRTAEYTGRYLVLLDRENPDRGLDALHNRAGTASAERVRSTTADTADTVRMMEDPGTSVLFPNLGVAVVEAQPDQRQALVSVAEEQSSIFAAEPERILYVSVITDSFSPAMTDTRKFPSYRSDEGTLERHARTELATSLGPAWDERNLTWGLQATRVSQSALTGQGIKVAVLDTGVDGDHPDLAGRINASASFIPGQAVDDGHGHGTHCIGTAAGPRNPVEQPRYGVAPEAQILAGKVLSNQGSGGDAQILAGINWALGQGAKVISMSLGSPTDPGAFFSQVFEQVAQRVMAAGTLIVAAAGNESRRPAVIRPVGHPANCPSILAVAALDKDLVTGSFSCGGLNPDGGEVNIAAPGVDVLSSWPTPTNYRRLKGTSMATPHVAGVVALIAQENPGISADELKDRLLSGAYRLPQPARDIGVGLVQAP